MYRRYFDGNLSMSLIYMNFPGERCFKDPIRERNNFIFPKHDRSSPMFPITGCSAASLRNRHQCAQHTSAVPCPLWSSRPNLTKTTRGHFQLRVPPAPTLWTQTCSNSRPSGRRFGHGLLAAATGGFPTTAPQSYGS